MKVSTDKYGIKKTWEKYLEHIVTLILAAGFSSRMQQQFKPLLPLTFTWPYEKTISALETLIQVHVTSGIRHIFVVSGQRETASLTQHVAQIKKKLPSKYHVYVAHNPNAQQGMFSSICLGLKTIQEHPSAKLCSHVCIQPVDIPLVRSCTIQKLIQAKNITPKAILIPTYKEHSGHPPLIPALYIKNIMEYTGAQGLRGALQALPQKTIPTCDSHMLLDMDTPLDYAIIQKKARIQHILKPQEALELLHCLHTAPKGLAHAQSVAQIATALAKKYLQQYGPKRMDVNLTKVGALLHDMCKQKPQHEQAAGVALRNLGFAALAPLVEEHNDCALDASTPVSEKELIYLADKYVFGSSFIPLTERFMQKLALYGHIPEACLAIHARLARAKTMNERVSKELGLDVALLAQQVLLEKKW